jgi:RNA polymerase sigma factor (sigma-70 family)
MEASTVPRAAPAGVSGIASPRLLRVASDSHLVELIRQGRVSAFEALYDRHHRAILSFCRHMLGSAEEAEDAVQHTFLAAYNDLIATDRPMHLRAWLFAIARNRCYSILRARREQPVAELDEPATEGLASQVERRQDLRDLVLDLGRLPDDQRAALVLSEMDALSHEQVGQVLGVPKDKVKALVFQARESLIASRTARETDCAEIREQLATLHGGALRRANLRRHLRECEGCREFRAEVDRQRHQLRLLLPVVPTIALKEAVLGATVGGSATATAVGGGTIATSLFKGGVVKGLLGAALAGVGTAGTIVAVHDFQVQAGGNVHSERNAATAPSGVPRTGRTAAKTGAAVTRPTAATTLPATGAGTASGAIAISGSRQQSKSSPSTLVAVLHPFSPTGLGGKKRIVSPLIPTTPLRGVTPSQPPTPQSGQAASSGNAPYLGGNAFGTGTQPAPPSQSPTSASSPSTPSTPVSSTPTYTPPPVKSGTSAPSHTSSSGSGRFSSPTGGSTSTPGTGPATGRTGSTTSTGSSSTGHSTSSATSASTPSTTTTTTSTTTSTTTTTTNPSGDSGATGPGTDPGQSGSGGYGGGTNTGPGGR